MLLVFRLRFYSMCLFVVSWVDYFLFFAVGVDHSRQGSGQPQSELWDGVPSTWSPTHGTQGTIMGLWHWGWMGPYHSKRKLHGATTHPSSLYDTLFSRSPSHPPPGQEHIDNRHLELLIAPCSHQTPGYLCIKYIFKGTFTFRLKVAGRL
ncbi:hypothetical protein XENOCAPTIV_014791 [Xenoophorus captivus]|uniref:Secreted protein n=1 Tax=Xenoophorus captivus TaxID=1517983 RepID=A0ABV0S2L4_9TELE